MSPATPLPASPGLNRPWPRPPLKYKNPALILALIPALAAQPGRFGFPACTGPSLELADRGFFLLCHDSSRKVPLWVAYQLKPEHLILVASYRGRFSRDLQLSGPTAAGTHRTRRPPTPPASSPTYVKTFY